MKIKSLKLDIFLKEAFFFVIAHILGILAVLRIYQIPELKAVIDAQTTSLNPLQFLLSFLIITVLFLLLLPLFKRNPIFLKFFFSLGVLIGLDIVMGVFLGEPYALILSLVLIVLLDMYPKVLFHNILFSCSLAGIGATLSTNFNPKSIVIVLGVLAFYDIIAVYFTKHMIKIARVPAEHGVFFGLILPKKNRDFLKNKTALKFGKKSAYCFLGGGDVVLPLILAVSVAKESLVSALIISLFSFFGLFLLHLIFAFQKVKRPMPGLPPLILMTILGYLITTLI
jgi:presenilin-like A22 family membrane protease